MKKLMVRFYISGIYAILDCAGIILSVFLAYGTYHLFNLGKEVTYEFSFLILFALILCGLVCSMMYLFGAYSRVSGILNVNEIKSVILGIVASLFVANAIFFSVRFMPSRYIVFISFLFMLLVLPLIRSVLYARLTSKSENAFASNALIYGCGDLARTLYNEICNSPRLNIKVCGFIDENPENSGKCINPSGLHTNNGCRVLGSLKDLPFLSHVYAIDEIFLAGPLTKENFEQIRTVKDSLNISVTYVPSMYGFFNHQVRLELLGNLPLVREQLAVSSIRFERVKRIFDLMVAAMLSAFLLPLMMFIALFIKLDSKGPVFFRQKRVGRNGRVFNMYKFRSMVQNAAPYAVNPDRPDDPRVTRVGRFLRKTSLDELPQIINVFRGEMSLVGPRPEMPFIVENYKDIHKERLKVLPGITGLWQLSGDRKKAIHENMDYDLYYIYNQSFFLDVTILLQTLVFAFKGV